MPAKDNAGQRQRRPTATPANGNAVWLSMAAPAKGNAGQGNAVWLSVAGPANGNAVWLSVAGPAEGNAVWLSVTGPMAGRIDEGLDPPRLRCPDSRFGHDHAVG